MPNMLVMSIYNFIPCPSAPLPAEPNQSLFEEFPQLYNTFSQLFLGQVSLKNVILRLRQFLIVSQYEYGPKKFIRMVQLAFQKLAEYAIIKLRTGMPHLTTLALTFLEKFCGNYLQNQTLFTISVLHAMNHLTCKNYDLALTKAKAISDQQQSNRGAKIIEGIALFNLGKLQQSRSIFTKVFRQVLSQMKSQKKTGVTEYTANSFCICAYFFSEIYRKQGQPLLSSFQLTKCVEAAQKWLKDGEHLIRKIRDTHSFQVEVKIPLRRLESKMHSLHISRKRMPKPNLRLPQKHEHLKEEDLNQVQNLFLIREKPQSYCKFREQALRSIEKERSQLKRLMEHDQCVIDQIRVKAQLLRDNYCTNDLEENIKGLQAAENKLLQEIDAKKWLIAKDIASTKVIEKGLKGFIACIKYSYLERVFKFLYSPMGIKSQTRLIIFVRKFLRRECRESISQCVFRGLKHQIQLLRSKDTSSKFRVSVYQLQTGTEGVNFNFEIREDVFNLLLMFPFYLVLHFNENNEMFLLTEHLELLKKTKVYGMVKGFGLRLHRKILIKNKQLSYSRLHHVFKIGSKIITSMLIFVTETSSTKFIQRIDLQKYTNPFYNFRFHLAAAEDIDKAILEYYNARRQQKSYTQIVKIQGSFRRLIAQKQAKNQRRITNVSCLQVKGVLFTLVKTAAIVLYIENIHRYNKKEIARLESTHELNLAFVVRLRAQLQSASGWEQMCEIVRKSIKMHEIANRIYERSRLAKFFQDFEAKFRKRLSFAKIIDKCKFQGEMREGRFMFMLTQIANSGSPREYMLRVFSLDSTFIDANKIVFSRDKMFLELNLRRIEQIVNLESRSVLQVQNNLRVFKQNRVMRREALIGISFKLRHKCAMKQADVQLIKKWITENNIYSEQQELSSESDSQ